MANPEKTKIMARLAMLEKHHGSQIRRTEGSYWIDRITNPVWLNAIRMTVVYLIGLLIWAVSKMDFLLDAFADDELTGLIRMAILIYLMVLALTTIFTLIISWHRNRKAGELDEEYRELLSALDEMDDREMRRQESRP